MSDKITKSKCISCGEDIGLNWLMVAVDGTEKDGCEEFEYICGNCTDLRYNQEHKMIYQRVEK